MKKKKENKRKVKKQVKRSSNILFVIIVILLIIFYIYKTSTLKDKTPPDKKDKEETKEEIKEKEVTEDPLTMYKKTSNFKLENLERYQNYKEKNPNLDYETVVTYVNIGLDYNFYGLISETDMSKNNLILVNKYLHLPENYEPEDLEEISSEYFISGNPYVREMRKDAKEAFEKLSKDSIENGTPVYGQSAFRSYHGQSTLYYNIANSKGTDVADSDTARPGHSEHQTGLTIDVSSTKGGNMESFGNTESFKWMKNNAYKYGFILRYPSGYENIHGYTYESWHYRYVGVKVATDMHDNYPTMTYDEYYYKFIDNKKID